MQIPKLFTAARRSTARGSSSAVVVCVDRSRVDHEGLGEEELSDLIGRLRRAVVEGGVGQYDGCDNFSSESRLYFYSADAQRLAGIATEIVSGLAWGHRVHVRVSEGVQGKEGPQASR